MHFKRIIAQQLTRLFPSTRSYPLKAALWRFGGLNVHRTARLVSSVKIFTQGSVIIGEDSFIGHGTVLYNGNANITIGAHVAVSSNVIIAGGSHEITPDAPSIAGPGTAKDVIIHDGAWVGIGAIILPGITIGKKAIIGAGSVVTKDVADYTVVAGNPAKLLRKLK